MAKNIVDHLNRLKPDDVKVGEITDPKLIAAITAELKDGTSDHPGRMSFHATGVNISAKRVVDTTRFTAHTSGADVPDATSF
ncbi:hypothetical protein ACFOY8_14490 [Thalassospira xianhensis]|uniref:Uncharacterized protein n=1 Tax=Thalassospira xianhensis MCCC 1A02616 TaxID=1177929 RepID=A0A367UHJ7_9PROT|nr:hypothetical protein [Thalassospira xianhensis]RCK07639.1 hypothetical protein TH5_00755 [Thalassospira xianhensis MCCC 1A02616]